MRLEWLPDFDERALRMLAELLEASVGDNGMLGFSERDSRLMERFLEDLSPRVRRGAAHVLLGRDGDRPVLMVTMVPVSHPTSAHIAELNKAIIHPGYRGRGLVHDGLGAVLAKAREIGIERLLLDVRADTRAAALWNSVGFRTYGELDDYARVDGEIHRGLYMVGDVEEMTARMASAAVAN